MKKILNKIPSFFKNFYTLTIIFFIIWMSFMDSNDLFSQMELSNKKAEMEESHRFYHDKILQVKNDHSALNNNPDLLEKIAREKYLMKKPNEDIYIIVR